MLTARRHDHGPGGKQIDKIGPERDSALKVGELANYVLQRLGQPRLNLLRRLRTMRVSILGRISPPHSGTGEVHPAQSLLGYENALRLRFDGLGDKVSRL